jgi:hypothetical protein
MDTLDFVLNNEKVRRKSYSSLLGPNLDDEFNKYGEALRAGK